MYTNSFWFFSPPFPLHDLESWTKTSSYKLIIYIYCLFRLSQQSVFMKLLRTQAWVWPMHQWEWLHFVMVQQKKPIWLEWVRSDWCQIYQQNIGYHGIENFFLWHVFYFKIFTCFYKFLFKLIFLSPVIIFLKCIFILKEYYHTILLRCWYSMK